jgi:hypothetical protein
MLLRLGYRVLSAALAQRTAILRLSGSAHCSCKRCYGRELTTAGTKITQFCTRDGRRRRNVAADHNGGDGRPARSDSRDAACGARCGSPVLRRRYADRVS